ncbi:type VI secretion system lipoprotein TssJ [Roseateles sp. BYS87W]
MAAFTSAADNMGVMKRLFTSPASRVIPIALAGLVSGCGSLGGDAMDKTLQAIGLQKPPVADSLKDVPLPPTHRNVTLRLHAGAILNTDPSGRPLATVVRVYRLKNTDSFLQSPYESFHSDTSSKPPPYMQDVIDVRELVLTPGQSAESIEKLGMDVGAIGVVALFRAPQTNRWKFVFDAKQAANSGITLGLHGCAMSVAQGQPLGAAPELLRVAGVRCQ